MCYRWEYVPGLEKRHRNMWHCKQFSLGMTWMMGDKDHTAHKEKTQTLALTRTAKPASCTSGGEESCLLHNLYPSTSGALHQGNTRSQSNPAKRHRERVVIRWQHVLYKSTSPQHAQLGPGMWQAKQSSTGRTKSQICSACGAVFGLEHPCRSSNLRHKNPVGCRSQENESAAPFYSINL